MPLGPGEACWQDGVMKVARIYQHGGPEVLVVEEAPEPEIKAYDVLIRVRASALNHLDLWVRRGIPGMSFPMPHVLGSDIAGEVVQTGALCRRIQSGRRVLLSPGLSCRQCAECAAGRDNRCPQYAIFGYGVHGGNREYMAAPEYAAIPIPDELSFEEAAAVPLVYLTAWHMLMTRAALEPGEVVLVVSAGSGVGSAAVQLAKWLRCRVIATAGSEDKLERARALGADHVIHHYRQDIAAEVKALTGGRGADVVFEHVGAATWSQSLHALARNGRLVTCGATTGYEVRLDLRFLFTRQQTVMGSFMGTLGELHQVLRLVFSKQVRAVVDRVYPLDEIRAAHQRLESKQQFGKVVLAL